MLNQPQMALDLVKQSINVEITKPLTGTMADVHLAMQYLLKATILTQSKDKIKEGLKAYVKAARIF